MIHLPSLHIQNYRQLQDLKVESLGDVNLIVGRNNAGKTSILEAIYLYAKKDPFVLRTLIEWRGDVPAEVDEEDDDSIKDFIYYFQTVISGGKINFDIPESLEISTIEKKFHYGITPVLIDNKLHLANAQTSLLPPPAELNIKDFTSAILKSFESINSEPTIGYIVNVNGKETTFSDTLYDKLKNRVNGLEPMNISVRLVPSGIMSDENLAAEWDQISLTEKEDDVYESMRLLHADLERIDFKTVGNELRAFAKLRNQKKPVQLTSMGEGIRRVFMIAMAMVNAENGFALIDEVENGIYYDAQESIWDWIFELSQKLNVQVFATTHSKDCWQAFVRATLRTKDMRGQLIRVAMHNGKNKAAVYGPDEMALYADSNIDIR